MCYLSTDIELAETSKRTKRSLAPKKLENNIAYNEEKGIVENNFNISIFENNLP